LGIGLERARAHPIRIEVGLAETAKIDRPEIEGWLTVGDPLGECHPGAAASRDAERIEACTHEDAAHLGRLPEDEVAVGSEALGAVDELLDARGLHGRNTADGELKQRLEMLEVIFEKLELKAVGKAVRGPRLRIGLIAAHHEPAYLLFPIGEAVRIAQRR